MEFKCLICGKVLRQLEEGGHLDSEQWQGLFHSGDVWEINCNFGSRFDTDKFLFGLCDDCISIKIDAGLLIPNGNIREDWVSPELPPDFLRQHARW